jgi:ACS family pantothenate transporter-like MFS transporter
MPPETEITQVAASDTPSESDNSKTGHHTTVAEIGSPTDEHKTTSWWHRIVGLVWDSLDGEPEYRHYVQRLDRIFLYVGHHFAG